jgi:hypothetical protein
MIPNQHFLPTALSLSIFLPLFRLQRFGQGSIFKRTMLELVARDLIAMHFRPEPSTHGGAVFKERSVRSGAAYLEGSRRGGSAGGLPGLGAFWDRSVRGGDRSSRGGDRSSRGGDRSSRGGDRSVRGAGVYLPIATPYSRRLATLLDSLGDGNNSGTGTLITRTSLRGSLKRLGYRVDNAEADSLFDLVDVGKKGQVSRTELSASLLDWKWVRDTYKDRWVESVERLFRELDGDGDGELAPEEIAAALSGGLCEYEVDAAVHEALLEALEAPEDGPGCLIDDLDAPQTQDSEGAGSKAAAGGTFKQQSLGRPSSRAHAIDFQHFLRLLQEEPDAALFDDRLSAHTSRAVTAELELERGPRRGLCGCFG